MRSWKEIHIKYLLILGFILVYGNIFSQTYQLTSYHTGNGLPTNLIKAVLQDENGFIWVSSDEGFSRFDGKKFTNVKDSLPTNYTKSLFRNQKEELFIITDLGILHIQDNYQNIAVKPFIEGTTNNLNPKKTMYPKKIFEDCEHNLWISEPNSLLKVVNGKTQRYHFPEEYGTNIYLRSFEIVEFDCKTLIVSSFMGHLLKFNKEKKRFEEIELPQKLNRVSALLKLDNQKVWLGTDEGIFEVEFEEDFTVKNFEKMVSIDDVSYLLANKKGDILVGTWHQGLFKIPHNRPKEYYKIEASKAKVINHIFLDREDNVWISSDDGLELLKPNFFHHYPLSEKGGYIEDIFYRTNNDLLLSNGINLLNIKNTKKGLETEILYSNNLYNIRSIAQFNEDILAGLGNSTVVFLKNKEVIKTINLEAHGGAVFLLYPDNKNYVWACQYGQKAGLVRIDKEKNVKHYGKVEGINSVITSVVKAFDGTLYFGGRGTHSYLYKYNYETDKVENISVPFKTESNNTLIVNDIVVDKQNNVWLASNLGLWKKTGKKIELIELGKYTNENIKAIEVDKIDKESFWIGTNLGVIKYRKEAFVVFKKNTGLSTVTTSLRGIVQNEKGNVFIGTADGLNYSMDKVDYKKQAPSPKILSLKADKKSIDWKVSDLTFENNTNLDLHIQSFTYPNEFVMYKYRIIGLSDEWSEPNFQNQISIQRIPYGKYILEVRAKEQGSFNWSKATTLKFKVNIPWYITWQSIISYFIFGITFVFVLVYANTYRLQAQKEKLQALVNKRTYQLEEKAQSLEQANEEIRTKNEDMALQQEALRTAFREIQRTNNKMTDSLKYAKTMQEAMLPDRSKIERFTEEHFIIYRPKDVVSGDFYWTTRFDDGYLLAVSDCTGHGVPGAMMSMIGNDLLYRIIKHKQVTDPAEILENLHQEVRLALRQKQSNNTDGMDILITYFKPIDENNWEMTFASAKRPLYYIKHDSKELHKLRGSRKAIGGFHDREGIFEKHIIHLEKGDTLYLMSDGFIDQNDKERRKFGSRRLEDLFKEYANTPLKEQEALFNDILDKHQKGTDQRDDITLLAIRL